MALYATGNIVVDGNYSYAGNVEGKKNMSYYGGVAGANNGTVIAPELSPCRTAIVWPQADWFVI